MLSVNTATYERYSIHNIPNGYWISTEDAPYNSCIAFRVHFTVWQVQTLTAMDDHTSKVLQKCIYQKVDAPQANLLDIIHAPV